MTASATHYFADGFEIRKLQTACRKLMQLDAVNGHLAMAGIYHLIGDGDNVFHHAKCAEDLSPGRPEVLGSIAAWLVNLGYFSQAHQKYGRAVEPSGGFFSRNFVMGFVMGAFQTMRAAVEKARKLNIDLSGLDADVAEVAACLLESHGVNDAMTASILDLAGELLRENHLFYLGDRPVVHLVDIDGVDSCVYLTYHVGTTPDQAADMTVELAARIAQRIEAIPSGFSVGFFGTLPS
jgi:hypothetical protein